MTIGRYLVHMLWWTAFPLTAWLPGLIAWTVWDDAGWQSIGSLVGAYLVTCMVLAAVTSAGAAAILKR